MISYDCFYLLYILVQKFLEYLVIGQPYKNEKHSFFVNIKMMKYVLTINIQNKWYEDNVVVLHLNAKI